MKYSGVSNREGDIYHAILKLYLAGKLTYEECTKIAPVMFPPQKPVDMSTMPAAPNQ